MNFTDIFIRRPVLATVISLLILVVGVRAAMSLPVLQYPKTENAVVTVTTAYFGADPDVVAGFITTPLESAIAQAAGIDYLTSSSTSGLSTITATLRLNYDYNTAQAEISSKVNSVIDQLPPQSQKPVITVQVGQNIASIYLSFQSSTLAPNQITDYLTRVVAPQVQAIPGVKQAQIVGARNFALRAWLDPDKLAAFNLTAADVNQALAVNDFISGLGNTKGQMIQVTLNASTSLHTMEDFRNLAVKQVGTTIVRLKDVAEVDFGSEDYTTEVLYNGMNSIVIAINIAPDASLLDVSKRMKTLFTNSIKPQLPEGLVGDVVFDAADFVNAAINEVTYTIAETLIIVMLVVFAFLGSLRTVLIPVVAIPLSLIGAFIMMLALGYSINLLTLLAMVLAIGLVVDDAIIVVENVHRHMNEGMSSFDAAIQAARELAGPIIAMLAVLVAVYVPIAFQGGLTGALFTEFAFTLVGTIAVSTIVALTLSPMMCSQLLTPHDGTHGWQDRVTKYVDTRFDHLHAFYERKLHSSLNTVGVTAVFALLVAAGIYGLVASPFIQRELAPQEDQGFVFVGGQGSSVATPEQYLLYAKQIYQRLIKHPEVDGVFQALFGGQFFTGVVLKPWDERSKRVVQISQEMTGDLSQVAGLNVGAFPLPSLPGPGGLPLEFVITTTQSFDRLNQVAQDFYNQAQSQFWFSQLDLKIDKPQATIVIDRDKAASIGLTMADVGNALTAMLSGGYVNYFSLDGRSYKVMAQADQPFRLNPQQLLNYYIHAGNGTVVPLSTIAHVETETVPQVLPHFQQLNAAKISGVPKGSEGDVLAALKALADKTLPDGFSIDYSGQSRQYIQESSGFLLVIGFAVVIIFLVLAALFESFRDPLIILTSVPPAIAGAMVFIMLFGVFGFVGASLNIYTEVGLVTLVGLISKHGIRIVDVANRLQSEGYAKRDAVEEAAGVRLRPILMTTAAMVLGVMPLLFANGAGAAARFAMGLTISSGIAIGTFFTLFVVPAFYMLLAEDHSKGRLKGEPEPHRV